MGKVVACAVLTIVAATLGLGERAPAAEISSTKVDEDLTAIFIIGDIKHGDGARFRAEAGKYDAAMVLLESDGGSTTAAIEIGEAIRLKGFATAVVNDSVCNSACALIWLAGTPRALSKSARVGFHATYIDVSGRQSESGVGNAIVGRYLTLLNLPERAVVFATTAPPSKLNWLNTSNYKSTGIEVSIIDDIDLYSDDGRKPDQIGKYKRREDTESWHMVGNWGVYVDHTLDDGCFLIGSFTNGTIFRVGINSTNGSYYIVIGNEAWRSLQEGSSYRLAFQFDNESPWDVPATGVKFGKSILLMSNFSDPNFWEEFVRSKTLNVSRESKLVTRINLDSTSAAFDELIKCQKAQDGKKRERDPFAD